MPLPVKVQIDGLQEACAEGLAFTALAATEAMREIGRGFLEDLRDQTFAAGLGTRLPTTWRLEIYPSTGNSLGAVAYIYSKAPKIMSFFSAQRMVTPLGQAFAIPVNPVIKRGGRSMTIAEVEARFNQDLQPRRLASGNIGLFADLIRAKSQRRKGFRQATAGRIAAGRQVELTLMFVLVRSLRSKPLIDIRGAAERWSAKYPGVVEKYLESQP